jgi:hypothetical protein
MEYAFLPRMRNFIFIVALSVAGAGFSVGCSSDDDHRVVEHKETDRPHILDNGRTHTSDTTIQNSDGSYSTKHEKVKTD